MESEEEERKKEEGNIEHSHYQYDVCVYAMND